MDPRASESQVKTVISHFALYYHHSRNVVHIFLQRHTIFFNIQTGIGPFDHADRLCVFFRQECAQVRGSGLPTAGGGTAFEIIPGGARGIRCLG